jgi:SAM-dependent methyltransferase
MEKEKHCMTPSKDYAGIAAIAWQLFSGEEPGADYPQFERLIQEQKGPALDVGCGTGRLLLPLLQAGLDVDGVEPSEDMLAICRQRAGERRLSPTLFQQQLQTLDLPRRYRTIMVPCGTLQLVVPLEEVWEALRRLYAHLEAGGVLALTVFPPTDELDRTKWGEWSFRAREALPDGTEIEKHGLIESANLTEQTLRCSVRYRRYRAETLLEERLCDTPERWFWPHELVLMLEKVGFRVLCITGNYTDAPATDEHYVHTYFAAK